MVKNGKKKLNFALLFFKKYYNIIYMCALEKSEGSILKIPILQGWDFKNPDEKQYTCNDLTTAYLFGKDHGEKDFKKGLVKKYKNEFDNEIKNIQKKGALFYDYIIDKGIEIKQLLLSITPINNYKLLYIITKESFLSSKFDVILNESHNMTNNTNNLDIIFMPYNKSLNTEKLLSDGYFVHYEKK